MPSQPGVPSRASHTAPAPAPSPEASYSAFLCELAAALHGEPARQRELIAEEFTVLGDIAIAFEPSDESDGDEGVRVLFDLGQAPRGRELAVYTYLLAQQLRNLPRAQLSVGLEPQSRHLMLNLFLENVPGTGELQADVIRQHLQVVAYLQREIAIL